MTQSEPVQDFQQKIRDLFIAPARSSSSSNLSSNSSSNSISNSSSSLSSNKFLAKSQFSTIEKLGLLEEVINEVEASRQKNLEQDYGEKNQVESAEKIKNVSPSLVTESPNEVVQATSPVMLSSSRKESGGGRGFNSNEQMASVQYVEKEKSPELSPEVESFIEQVQKDESAPKEIVIADAQSTMPADDQYVSERVVVLPITPEIEKKGKRKSAKFSVRWLVEWSQKIIKMFEGKVMYREA